MFSDFVLFPHVKKVWGGCFFSLYRKWRKSLCNTCASWKQFAKAESLQPCMPEPAGWLKCCSVRIKHDFKATSRMSALDAWRTQEPDKDSDTAPVMRPPSNITQTSLGSTEAEHLDPQMTVGSQNQFFLIIGSREADATAGHCCHNENKSVLGIKVQHDTMMFLCKEKGRKYGEIGWKWWKISAVPLIT